MEIHIIRFPHTYVYVCKCACAGINISIHWFDYNNIMITLFLHIHSATSDCTHPQPLTCMENSDRYC